MDKNSIWYIWASDTAPSLKRRMANGDHILPHDVARMLDNDTDLIADDAFRMNLISAFRSDASRGRRLPIATRRMREAILGQLLDKPHAIPDSEIRMLVLSGLKGELKPKRGRPRDDVMRFLRMECLSQMVEERTAEIWEKRKANPGMRQRGDLEPCVQAAEEIGLEAFFYNGRSLLNAISRHRRGARFPVKDYDRMK